jgi:hypothetical protein
MLRTYWKQTANLYVFKMMSDTGFITAETEGKAITKKKNTGSSVVT